MSLEVWIPLAAVAVLGLGYMLIRLYFSEKEAHVRRVLKQIEGEDDNG